MYVQLTHLCPKPNCYDLLLTALEQWGNIVKDDQPQPEYSFISHTNDHIFVVAIYKEQTDYNNAVESQKELFETVSIYLIENHGPTFSGNILQLNEKNSPDGPKGAVPHGIFIPRKANK